MRKLSSRLSVAFYNIIFKQGMDSIRLIQFMAWVPLVGSAVGNVLGGFVSDYVVGERAVLSRRNSRRSRLVTTDSGGSGMAGTAARQDAEALLQPFSRATLDWENHFERTGDGRTGEIGSSEGEDVMQRSLVMGDAGRYVADVKSDLGYAADDRHVNQSFRVLVAGWSNILPIPLVICSLTLEYPYCFVVLIGSGMVS
jgi:hypothetical protein